MNPFRAVYNFFAGAAQANDRGFLVRDGHELRWSPYRLPLAVYLDDNAVGWLPTLSAGIGVYNQAVGRRLFFSPTAPIAEVSGFFANDRALWPRGLYVRVDPELAGDGQQRIRGCGGFTDLRWDKRTGEMLAARTSLPRWSPALVNADGRVLHELGHVLGLDHDGHPSSCMHEVLGTERVVLFSGDAQRLAASYRT